MQWRTHNLHKLAYRTACWRFRAVTAKERLRELLQLDTRLASIAACTVLTLVCAAIAASPASAATLAAPAITPSAIPLNVATPVTFTVAISDSSLIPSSVNLQQLDPSGPTFNVIGTLYDDGTHGDAVAGDGTFTLQLNLTATSPYPISFRVSAAFRGSLTRSFSNLATLNVTGAPPATITFTSPANLSFFNASPITVTGIISGSPATVTINGIPVSATSGGFTVSVPLQEGNNTLTATAKTAQGEVSTASLQVTLDTTPPRVSIDSPFDGFITTASSLTVTGKANDTVVGTVSDQQVKVTVNGAAAQVANRSFTAANIPLALGDNLVSATARDRAGNGATAHITVHRDAATQPHISAVSGNDQTAAVGATLAGPITAALVDGSGSPVAGVAVVFAVTQNNGTLGNGKSIESATTNSAGQASVPWTIGTRSGAGNNIVEATAAGFVGSAMFTASGTPGSPGQINLDAGSPQTGAVGKPLPHPFVVAVTDAVHNRLLNIPVTFIVKQGGGNFAGQTTVTTNTDSDGRALAILTLGPKDGIANNIVEANFPGNTGFPAAFSASGKIPGDPAATRIVGVVLDNTNNPVQGATIRAFLNNVGAQQSGGLPPNVSAVSNAQGQFVIQPAPVGYVKIIADGSTVQRPGKWPNLEYELVTVSGQTNTIGLPIYLLPLDLQHQLCVSDTQGGTLTLPAIPGFSLSVLPGAATFPGGAKSGCITVTAVHPDKIPMVPGFGQQPRFIVTIQPAGTLFSPPAAISIPNADGLKPREVTEMYSFDHDLGTFVSVGSATVSDDATLIRSDPGVGVLKAGWYCGGPPTPAGSVGVCGECKTCNGSTCVPDPLQDGNMCTAPPDTTGVCLTGNCPNFKGVLTARDNFAGRSKTRFGVGEIVDLTAIVNGASASALGGLQWRIVSGGGTLTSGTDGTGTYTAPGLPASVVLRIEVASGKAAGRGQNYSIAIIAPSGAHMVKDSNLRHKTGFAGVGFLGNIFLEPTDVSFTNMTFGEGTVNAVASGFYAPFNGLAHPQDTFSGVGMCNLAKGCLVTPHDMVDSNDKGGPFSVGDFVWAIPWQYWVGAAGRNKFATATHHMYTDAVGKASIEKAGAGPFSKNVNDANSTY